MGRRPFYLLSWPAAIVAIVASVGAHIDASRAAAAAAEVASSFPGMEGDPFEYLFRWYLMESRRMSAFAVALIVTASVSWTCSIIRREPGLRSPPLVLILIAAVVLLLV